MRDRTRRIPSVEKVDTLIKEAVTKLNLVVATVQENAVTLQFPSSGV
jgi:hypothetical protein